MASHRWLVVLAAGMVTLAAAARRATVAAHDGAAAPATLQTVPYSAIVVRALEAARRGLAQGRGEAALSPLHELLQGASPALSAEKLLLHREVARAFLELGYPDHALRTLSVALYDAEAAQEHEQALAIKEELDAVYVAFRLSRSDARDGSGSDAVETAGLFDRFLPPRQQHPHANGPVTAPPTSSPAPMPSPVPPGPATVPPSGAVAPMHTHPPLAGPRVSLWQRVRHFFHALKPPRLPAPAWQRPAVTRRRAVVPGLPQYPRAECETCRKNNPRPSLATPPPPPQPGPVLPNSAAPYAPGVPLSPYSAVPPNSAGSQPPSLPMPPRHRHRPSMWRRFSDALKGTLQRFRQPPTHRHVPTHISPAWPEEAVQMGNTLQGEPIR